MYIKLHYNDEQVVDLLPNKYSSFDAFYVDFEVEEIGHSVAGKRIKFTIHPKQDFILNQIELIFSANSQQTASYFFSNAFQSALETRQYPLTAKMPKAIRNIKGLSNDSFHSWTYAFLSNQKQLEFIGSLNEWTGFSLILFEKTTSEWIVRKDLSNIKIKHSFPVFDLIWMKATEEKVFAQYIDLMDAAKKEYSATLCWIPKDLSHFNNQFTNQLKAWSKQNINFDTILLDKNYCSYWGDWLSPKVNLGAIVQLAHEQNFKIGISIAPFVCEAASEIYKNKSAWILKNEIVKSNLNTKKLYAIDISNKEVQDALSGLFYKIFNQWHFDFVKLDLLDAACNAPHNNRTTGQLCHDAIRFLKENIGEHFIAASDLAIGAAFGKIDALQIAHFDHDKWNKNWWEQLLNNKTTTIVNALRSTLNTWQLNGKIFSNIGIPFSLKKTKQFSIHQQYTILLINTLLTNWLISADDFGQYDSEQWGELKDVLQWRNSSIVTVNQLNTNQYNIHFTNKNKSYQALINLGNNTSIFKIDKREVTLEPFESIVLLDA